MPYDKRHTENGIVEGAVAMVSLALTKATAACNGLTTSELTFRTTDKLGELLPLVNRIHKLDNDAVVNTRFLEVERAKHRIPAS